MIVFGTNTFGGTDEVDDLFKVKTQFFHVWFVPLIPISSYLVVDESMGSFNGIRIPFSIKSMLIAWGRTALFFGAIFAMIGVAANAGSIASAVFFGFGAAICIALLIASYAVKLVTHASYERAIELVNSAGIGPQLTPVVNQVFGKGGGYDQQFLQQQVVDTFGGAQDQGVAPGGYPQANLQEQPYAQPLQPHGAHAPVNPQAAYPPPVAPVKPGPLVQPNEQGIRWGRVLGYSAAGLVGLLLCGGVFTAAFMWILGGIADRGEQIADNNRQNPPEFVQPPEMLQPIPPVDQTGRKPGGNGNNGARGQRRNSGQPEMSIDQAINLIVSGDASQRNDAYRFFSDSDNLEKKRRMEVSEALMTVPADEDSVPWQAFTALKIWAIPENIPELNELARGYKTGNDSSRLDDVIEILIQFDDLRAAEGLVFAIDDREAKERLAGLGPECAGLVLPFLNHEDYSSRNNARELLLETWQFDQGRVIGQCLNDVQFGSPDVVDEAAELLVELEPEEVYRAQMATALEFVVLNADEDAATDAIEKLATYGRLPESADAIANAVQMFPDSSDVLNEGIKTLGALRSAASIPVIVEGFQRDAREDNVRDALISIGTPEAAEAAVPWFNSEDYSKKRAARAVVDAIGRHQMVVRQCAIDLKSGEVPKIRSACEWLKEQPVEASFKSEVSRSLTSAIETTTEADDTIAARACLEVCRMWGDASMADSVTALLGHENSLIAGAAFEALGEMKIRSTYPIIAAALMETGANQFHARRALEAIGNDAEQAVIGMLERSEGPTLNAVIGILGKIGGRDSIRELRKITRRDDIAAKFIAERAIEEIESRPREERPSATSDGPIVRTWRDSTGENEIVGKLLDFVDGKAVLEVNGEIFQTPMSLLSEADQEYVRNEMALRNGDAGSDD